MLNFAILLFLLCLLPTSLEATPDRFPRQKYCQIHANHTLCLYQVSRAGETGGQQLVATQRRKPSEQDSISARCGEVLERGLSPSEREEVVRLHNERRAFIANGLEARGDPGPQPKAANMMELVGDGVKTAQNSHTY